MSRALFNIQYAVKDEKLYLIEVNPRASRTTPFVAKATGVSVAAIAAQVMAGKPLSSFTLAKTPPRHYAVKEVTLPFARFPHADILLGPEMKSTGEAMGWDQNFHHAFAKAQLSVMNELPLREGKGMGVALVAYGDDSRNDQKVKSVVNRLQKLGLEVHLVEDLMRRKQERFFTELVQSGKVTFTACIDSGPKLKDFRRLLVMNRVTYFTTHEAVDWAIQSMEHCRGKGFTVHPIQSFQQ